MKSYKSFVSSRLEQRPKGVIPAVYLKKIDKEWQRLNKEILVEAKKKRAQTKRHPTKVPKPVPTHKYIARPTMVEPPVPPPRPGPVPPRPGPIPGPPSPTPLPVAIGTQIPWTPAPTAYPVADVTRLFPTPPAPAPTQSGWWTIPGDTTPSNRPTGRTRVPVASTQPPSIPVQQRGARARLVGAIDMAPQPPSQDFPVPPQNPSTYYGTFRVPSALGSPTGFSMRNLSQQEDEMVARQIRGIRSQILGIRSRPGGVAWQLSTDTQGNTPVSRPIPSQETAINRQQERAREQREREGMQAEEVAQRWAQPRRRTIQPTSHPLQPTAFEEEFGPEIPEPTQHKRRHVKRKAEPTIEPSRKQKAIKRTPVPEAVITKPAKARSVKIKTQVKLPKTIKKSSRQK